MFSLVEDGSLVRAGGSSGAIAGLMGGYLLLFPKARIVHLFLFPNVFWPFSIIIRLFWRSRFWGYWPIWIVTFGLPAWILLLGWLLLNIAGARFLDGSQIAYWIHLGGFAAGLALMLPFLLFRSSPGAVSETPATLEDKALTAPGREQPMARPGPWDRAAARNPCARKPGGSLRRQTAIRKPHDRQHQRRQIHSRGNR